MINNPNIVYPNNNTLDGGVNNEFSFVFYGDKLKQYQISINQIDTNASVYLGAPQSTTNVYNNSEVKFTIPANSFPNAQDLVWFVTMWEDNPTMFVISGVTQSGSTATAIKIRQHRNVKNNMYISIGGERRKISAYDFNSGTATVNPAFSFTPATNISYQIFTDFIISPAFPFKSRNKPVINIVNIPTILNTRTLSLTGSYSQAQSVPIKYHIWNLYDRDNRLINTSDKVYSSNLKYEFDGLSGSEHYFVSLTVVNQDNVQVDTIKHRFDVSYNSLSLTVPPKVEILQDQHAVMVSWVGDKQSSGVASNGSGAYEFVTNFPFAGTNSVYLKSGTITYNTLSEQPLEIDDSNFSVLTSVRLDEGFQGKIIEIESDGNTYGLKLINNDFIVYKNNSEYFLRSLYPTFKHMFTATGVPEEGVYYGWDDNTVWDDSLKLTESITPYLSLKQWKISILPNQIVLKEVV